MESVFASEVAVFESGDIVISDGVGVRVKYGFLDAWYSGAVLGPMSWGILSTIRAFVCGAVWLGVLRVVAVVAPAAFGFSCV